MNEILLRYLAEAAIAGVCGGAAAAAWYEYRHRHHQRWRWHG